MTTTFFMNYSAEENNTVTGVRMLNKTTKKVVEISGLINTVVSSLIDLRFEKIIPTIE